MVYDEVSLERWGLFSRKEAKGSSKEKALTN